MLWKTPDGAAAREYLSARVRRGRNRPHFHAWIRTRAPSQPGARAREARIAGGGGAIGPGQSRTALTRDMFRGRLMFPIRDGQGRVLAFGGRVLDQRLRRGHINSPESALYSKSRNVYGLYEARAAIASTDRAIVVEGYLDAIAVWQAGFKETVASLGTALTVDQRCGSWTPDAQRAGLVSTATRRGARLRCGRSRYSSQPGVLGREIFIPPGFDPDTFIKERGAQAFAELIASADLLDDYFIAEQAAAARGSLEARARAAAAVAEVLQAVHNASEFDLRARKAADALGVGEEVLRAEARRPARGGASTAPPRSAGRQPRPPSAAARRCGRRRDGRRGRPARRRALASGVARRDRRARRDARGCGRGRGASATCAPSGGAGGAAVLESAAVAGSGSATRSARAFERARRRAVDRGRPRRRALARDFADALARRARSAARDGDDAARGGQRRQR